MAAAEGLALRDVWDVGVPLAAGVPLRSWVEAFGRQRGSAASRALFGIRRKIGRALALDRGSAGLVPVYRDAEEELSRLDNRTVTAFLHVSLVDRRPQLAVYVKPKGRLGRAYMALIEPFRRWVVYPSLLAAGRRAAASLSP